MKYYVQHFTNFSERVIQKDLSFEEAKKQVDLLASEVESDGLGQGRRTIEHAESLEKPGRVPYQVLVTTMTAEAGEVLDGFAVVVEPDLSVVAGEMC